MSGKEGPADVSAENAAGEKASNVVEEEWVPTNLTAQGAREWEKLGGLCPVHIGESVCFFCVDCMQACCTVCGMTDHCNHQKKHRGEVIPEGKFGHTGLFFPSEFLIEGVLKSLNEDLQNVDIEASERIEQCFSSHQTALAAHKRSLIDHINAVKKARLKYLQGQQKQLRKTCEELTATRAHIQKYSDSDDDFSFLAAEKESTRRVAELNERCSKMSLPTEGDWGLDNITVVRNGVHVKVNRGRRPPPLPPRPGVKSLHDPTFRATSVKLHFSLEPDMFAAFVKTCCQELGEKYWLRVQ